MSDHSKHSDDPNQTITMSHGYRRSASSIHSQQDSPHQSRPVSSHSIVPPNIPMAEQTDDSVTQLLAGLKLDTTSHSKKLSSQTKTIKGQNQIIQSLKTKISDMKISFQDKIIKMHNSLNQRFKQIDTRFLNIHHSSVQSSS
jgi:hypothetical protein